MHRVLSNDPVLGENRVTLRFLPLNFWILRASDLQSTDIHERGILRNHKKFGTWEIF